MAGGSSDKVGNETVDAMILGYGVQYIEKVERAAEVSS
jgi:hypothetical protein